MSKRLPSIDPETSSPINRRRDHRVTVYLSEYPRDMFNSIRRVFEQMSSGERVKDSALGELLMMHTMRKIVNARNAEEKIREIVTYVMRQELYDFVSK